jgi:hypothetical protein
MFLSFFTPEIQNTIFLITEIFLRTKTTHPLTIKIKKHVIGIDTYHMLSIGLKSKNLIIKFMKNGCIKYIPQQQGESDKNLFVLFAFWIAAKIKIDEAIKAEVNEV